jgi:hypothetical protein
MTSTTRNGTGPVSGSWSRIALLVALVSALVSAGYLYVRGQQPADLSPAFAVVGAAIGVTVTAIESNARLKSAFDGLPRSIGTAAFVLLMMAVVAFLSESEAIAVLLGFGGGVLGATVVALVESRLRP